MARYTVDILDNNGQRIGFVPAPVSPEYRRRQNQATSFSFGVLMDDDVASLLTHGRQCVLRRDGAERVAGTVTRRDASGQVMRVECITNEALLRDIVTPADWNYWAGWKLGDAVRDLLVGFAAQARNTPDDWADAAEKVNVDLTTWPGKVVLAKDATGHYKSHGYITLQLDFGLISRYQALRWSEDAGQEVRIKAQFRTSANGTSWSAWSQELQSVFPAEDGVALTGSERYIQVRMHLYTDNTSEKDANGVPTGYTPVLSGVEVIARKLGPVTEGGIEATPDVTIPAYRSENEDQKETYSFNRENALRILQTWCEDFGYEFRVDGQRRLYFGKNLGAVRQVVLRRTTNMDVKGLGDSADKLVNVLHCYGAGDGPAQIRTTLRNQDSINLYGERYGEFEDSSADTLAKLIESGNTRLAKVSQPEPQFAVHHVPVHELGEDMQLYDTVTVVDPRSGLVTTARILDEERKLTMAGEDVSLGLNCDLDNIIERIVKGQIPRPKPGGLPPEAPSDVRATPGYGYVQITWSGNASLFVVEHSGDGVTFSRLDQTPYRNYLHMGLEPGSTHYYRVTAVSSGGSSPPSSVVSAVVSRVPPEDLDQTPPATPIGLVAVSGASTEAPGITTAWVELSWTANAEIDLKDYYLRRKASGATTWEHVATVPKDSTSHTDRVGVVPGTTYEYCIAASDVAGNVSVWSQAVAVSVPTGITLPGAPTGLSGTFTGVDAIATWNRPGIPDFARTVVEVQVGGVTKRTSYETGTTFSYTQAMNIADNGTAKPSVTIRIAHENHKGGRSGWASVTLTNGVPTAPTGFAMSSTDGTITLGINDPGLPDFGYVEFQLALQSGYGDAATVYKGRSTQGITVPIKGTGTNYGRARVVDAFGQAGPWANATVVGQPIPTYTPDTTPPAVPTGLTATGTAAIQTDGGLLVQVALAWNAVADTDLRAFAIRRRKGTGAWEQLATILATPGTAGAYTDAAGLVTGVAYEYQVTAGDASGNWSAWSTAATVTVASDTTAPPAPTGLTGVFRDNDAVFGWDPCIAFDYRQSRLEIVTGGTTKRTGRIDGTTFVYSLAMNRADHAMPQPSVTIKVAHEDRYGNVSSWTTVTASKAVPAAPTGFTMFSALTMIQMGCDAPDPTEVDSAEFQLATTSNYSDATTVHRGSTYQGVMAPIRVTGLNHGRVRFFDIFGQAGAWATRSCTATLITKGDLQGAIFQITPTSIPAPASGTLEQLWDADTTTGPVFDSSPTIEFEYPMAWFFDMVRFWTDRDCSYYVQAWREEQQAWADVAGSATAKIAATGNEWTVQRFDGNKMIATTRLRIAFDRAVKVTELKFWTITFADEILAQAIQAWQINTASITIGSLDGGQALLQDVGKAQQDASDAITAAATAQATADGKVTTYFQAAEPTAEALGDLWMDTDDGNKLYRWDGSQWVEVQDAGIAEAIAAAADAQSTADGKIVTYCQAAPPTAGAVGDLWVDTDDHNRLYRWNGTNWADVNDTVPINADVQNIRLLNNQIWLDSTGLKMKNADVQNVMMHLDANRLGFWDPVGEPTIGLGDVADMATALGSDMQYGLLLAQGEIRATEAVIRKSLAQGLVGQKHVEDGSVTLKKLSDLLSVTIPDRFQLYAERTLEGENKLTNPGFETGSLTGWTGTGTIMTNLVHSGSYAVNKANLYQEVSASAGQAWVGQAWARPDIGKTEYVTLQFLDSNKTVLSTIDSPGSTPAQWTLLRVVGVAPANTAYVRLVIKAGLGANNRFDDCVLAQGGVSTSDYVAFAEATIAKDEAYEQIKVNAEIDNPDGVTVHTRVLVNGATKLDTNSAVNPVTVSLTLDVRDVDDDITVQVQAKTGSGTAMWNKAEIMTNQRLPLRGAPPRYAITSSSESSCGTTCEAACQADCQKTCQASCQTNCQDSCQTTCMSTCEQTSQGGGCWVEGTPVTICLPESEIATEIPVEKLEPGMQMPYYDPATDTLAITVCLSNMRSYTHTVFVAEVEGGWTLEMTREQPMDVLRAHLVTGQVMWHRLQARYLRPGDKLIRPFDKTLHTVLSVRQEERPRTWVWNPKTAAGAYIAHGFADAISKT